MIKIIDYKAVDMTKEESDYHDALVKEFTYGEYQGKNQFHDIFDVDNDGCINFIKPPLKKEIGWAVIVFLQNLMLNQRIRRMERKIEEFLNDNKRLND